MPPANRLSGVTQLHSSSAAPCVCSAGCCCCLLHMLSWGCACIDAHHSLSSPPAPAPASHTDPAAVNASRHRRTATGRKRGGLPMLQLPVLQLHWLWTRAQLRGCSCTTLHEGSSSLETESIALFTCTPVKRGPCLVSAALTTCCCWPRCVAQNKTQPLMPMLHQQAKCN